MPVAIPWIALALTAAGTGVAVAGQMEQAASQEKAAKFNAAVADNNAIAQQQQAQFDSDRLRKRQLILLGKQRANAAKSGIDQSSIGDVLYDSALEGELDRLAVLYTGTVASNNQRSAAQLHRAEASNAATMGLYRSTGTLLTGAGNMAGQYNRIQNPTFGSED